MQKNWTTTLNASGAVIVEDDVVHFGDLEGERRAAADGNICADLSHLALIRAEGVEAKSFLQGQLSNDVHLVTSSHSQLSAYCSPKGRMLAIMRLFKRDEAYYLLLPRPLLEPTLKRLSMFVLRAKVKLEAQTDWVGLGLAGSQAAVLIEKAFMPFAHAADACRTDHGITALGLPGKSPRYAFFGSVERLQALWQSLTTVTTPVGAPVWRWLDIQAGLPTVLPGTVEEFVPQMANLELVGGVSFKKGCYPGQEIVARMHYLGRLKQRMIGAHVHSATCPVPGASLYAADFPDQSAGKVVDAQPAPAGGYDLLAVVQISSIENADIHLDNLQGPLLQLTPLPYPLSNT